MKKKKYFLLLPIVSLTSCIGANWEVLKDYALVVAEKIMIAQDQASFSLPKHYYYSSDYFLLTERYNSEGKKDRTESKKYSNSALMDLSHYKLKYISKERNFVENELAATAKTSVSWIYAEVDTENYNVYQVINTGEVDGKTYKVTTVPLNEFSKDVFLDICKPIFDQSALDIKGDTFLELGHIEDEVIFLNSLESVDAEIKFFSRREGTLIFEINKTMNGYYLEDEIANIDGVSREIYGWQDNLFVNHEFYQQMDKVADGKREAIICNEKNTIVLNPVNKTEDKNSKEYIVEYDFDIPDLTSYKLLENVLGE